MLNVSVTAKVLGGINSDSSLQSAGWVPLIKVLFYLNNCTIGLVSRVFANGPGDRGSIPG